MVLLWDMNFTKKYPHLSTWSSEVKEIFQHYGLGYFSDHLTLFPIKEVIGTLKSKMKARQNGELRVKCADKPQLRHYIQFKNFDIKPPANKTSLFYSKEVPGQAMHLFSRAEDLYRHVPMVV